MRLARMRRSWSRRWWGVFFFALLAMNSYVLFDILDVDGSQRIGWPGDDITATDDQQVESDRFLHSDLPSLYSAGLFPVSASPRAAMDSRGSSLATTIRRIRYSRVLPRVNLRGEPKPADTSSVDPA